MNSLFLADHEQWLMRMSCAGVFVCFERWFGEDEARLELEKRTWYFVTSSKPPCRL